MRKSLRTVLCLFVLACLLCGPCAGAQRAVMLTWDGAADWIVDKLLSEGDLPNLARIAKNGVCADYTVSSYPSKTAVAHAAIYTGTWLTGVCGNSMPAVPRDSHPLTEMTSGFDGKRLLAEPIWMTACKNGEYAAILSGPQTGPPGMYYARLRESGIPEDRLFILANYSRLAEERFFSDASVFTDQAVPPSFPAHNGAIRGKSVKLGSVRVSTFFYDSPQDPVNGFDTAIVYDPTRSSSVVLKPGLSTPGTLDKFSAPMQITVDGKIGCVRFRLLRLAPDGSDILLYHTGSSASDSKQSEQATAIIKAAGGDMNPPLGQYKAGMFGKTVFEGGDGTAEKYLYEMFRLYCDRVAKLTLAAMPILKWNVLVNYDVLTDSIGHEWVGAVDPTSPFYDEQKAKLAWPLIKEAYRINDEALGRIYDALPKDANLVLFSDHGMEGGNRVVCINRVLEAAGLLKGKDKGEIDIASSKAMAVADGGSVYLNMAGRNKGGIVPSAEKAKVLDAVKSALLSVVDPATGMHPICKVFDSEDAGAYGVGSAWGTDLLLDFATGYGASTDMKDQPTIYNDEPLGFGMHGPYPYKRQLQGIFYAAGPGFAKGKVVPGFRLIDIAPTVCRMIGIPAPKDACGVAIAEALSPR